MGNKSKYSKLLAGIIACVLITTQSFAQGLNVQSLEIAPNLSNYVTRISVDLQPTVPFSANQDFITLIFHNDFHVPSSISKEHILIGDYHPLDVYVSGKSVSLRLPENLQRGARGRRTITIHQSAGIYNPRAAGTFSIGLTSTRGDGIQNSNVTVVHSQSTVHSVMLNPLPPTALQDVDLYINFMSGDGGLLKIGEYVDVIFPDGFTIPRQNIAGVTVNELSASAEGLEDNVLRVIMPFTARYSTCVAIRVNKGSGILNPPAGTYTYSVLTSSEPDTIESVPFTINDIGELSAPSVNLVPDFANAFAQIPIRFFTGNFGVMQAQKDYYEFTFPQSMTVPTAISTNNVFLKYDGFTEAPHSVTVMNDNKLRVVPNRNIEMEKILEIVFQPEAGIQSPNQWGGYTIKMQPFQEGGIAYTSLKESNNFYVGKARSLITSPRVWFDRNNQGGVFTEEMTIEFNTGRFGRLLGGIGFVRIELPKRADLRNYGSIRMNGTYLQENEIHIDYNEKVMFLTLPSEMDIQNLSKITIIIDKVDNLRSTETYQLYVDTSVEIRPVASEPFNGGSEISNTLSISSYTISDLRVNRPYQLTLNLTNFTIRVTDQLLMIRFPNGTIAPTAVTTNNISISKNGTSVHQHLMSVAYEMNSNILVLELNSDLDMDLNDVLQITIASAMNFRHPSLPDIDHPIEVRSSDFRIPAVFNYRLSGNESSVMSVTTKASPNHAGATNVSHEVAFNVGSLGRLSPGNRIWITFPGEVILPASLNPSNVRVNGAPSSHTLIDGQSVRVTIGNEFNMNNSATIVSVLFENILGIQTQEFTGDRYLTVIVSTDVLTESSWDVDNLHLTESADLQIAQFITSSLQVNAQAGFTLQVQLGSSDAIFSGNTFFVRFPENFQVPHLFETNHIQINDVQISSPATASQNTITITAPETYLGGEIITIAISQNAGIINSMTSNGYRVSFSLNSFSWIEGPLFTLHSAISQVTRATVTPDPAKPDHASSYLITFRVGDYGRLLAGASTIEINFPGTTSLALVNDVTVNNELAQVNISNRRLTILVPASVQILNNSEVSIFVEDITNPSLEATDYTVTIRTSVEQTATESFEYHIAHAGPVTLFNQASFTLVNSTVNKPMQFTLNFEVSIPLLTEDDDIITIHLPEDTQIPSGFDFLEFDDPIFRLNVSGQLFDITTLQSVNRTEKTISFAVPTNILPEYGTIILTLEGNPMLRNPSEPGAEYTVSLSTSKQPVRAIIENVSVLASFETSVQNVNIHILRSELQQEIEIFWTFYTGSLGALQPGKGRIIMLAPTFIALPEQIDQSAIMVNNIRPQEIHIDGNLLTIKVPNSVAIQGSEWVQIIITRTAGIVMTDGIVSQSSHEMGNSAMQQTIVERDYFQTATSAEPEFVTSQDNVVLPVELANFSISGNGHIVTLEWNTLTEYENYGFYVERAYQQTSSDDVRNWSVVGFIEGAGSSTTKKSYHFVDPTLEAAGNYIYRLIQMDFDGQTTTYGPLKYAYLGADSFELMSNYPNPFNPVTVIPYTVAKQTMISLTVYDVLGRRVQVLVSEELPSGRYHAQFDGSRLASGIYFVRMQADGQTFTQKMMLIK